MICFKCFKMLREATLLAEMGQEENQYMEASLMTSGAEVNLSPTAFQGMFGSPVTILYFIFHSNITH
jgi:hypothetical protein